jgi:hypothetical protein
MSTLQKVRTKLTSELNINQTRLLDELRVIELEIQFDALTIFHLNL